MPTDLRIDTIYGQCPVQAEGTIDGAPFYFRARGERWRIEIGPGNTALIVAAPASHRATVEASPVWRYEQPYGDEPFAAGWMEHDEARAFIAEAANRWRASSSGQGAANG